MDKEQARKILEEWVVQQVNIGGFVLPFVDQKVVNYIRTGEPFSNEPNAVNKEWTFKGLVKIAYDLEDKK